MTKRLRGRGAEKATETLKGRRVGVIGAGRSGISAAKLLWRRGAHVLLSEKGSVVEARLPRGVELETGGHSARLLQSDFIVRSPGVPNHLPILARARRKGIALWSELELAAHEIHPKRLIAITGTNGKTTTTSLVGALFRAAFPGKTFVGGNIGVPLSDLATKIFADATVILEVSSYQLEDIHQFHPQFSAILNVGPDHLEHHGSMRAYENAKARIFENQRSGDVCVLNADDPVCVRLAKRCPARVLFFSRKKILREGVVYKEGEIFLHWKGQRCHWPLEWSLPGLHNVENALAAIGLAVAAGLSIKTIQRVFRKFKGVEHRLEWVRDFLGVRYVNDSKATNVDSTRVALEAFPGPLIMIMGGEGKGSPYDGLAALVQGRVKRLLLIGQDALKIRRALHSAAPSEMLQTLDKAVFRANQLAVKGDTVLLSPACASFDQYKNYEERGRHFKTLVQGLRS